MLSISRMEVRRRVVPMVHCYDNAKESTEFRHFTTYTPLALSLSTNFWIFPVLVLGTSPNTT